MTLFDQANFKVEPDSNLILVKIDGTFFRLWSKNIKDAELTYNFQMSSSDITYLAPNKAVRGIVSISPDKFRIYEFYVNDMQFPEDKSKGMDLFISLTPCSGKLQFFISDERSRLFKGKAKITDDKSVLDVTTNGYKNSKDPNSKVNVVHKSSKISS